jgi:hypothetical protein
MPNVPTALNDRLGPLMLLTSASSVDDVNKIANCNRTIDKHLLGQFNPTNLHGSIVCLYL